MKTPPPAGDFRKLLERIAHRRDLRQVFEAFLCFAACALAAQTREKEYLEEVKRWERTDLDLFGQALGALVWEMETKPFEDVIGGYYVDVALSTKGRQWNGEFHTPKNLCELIAGVLLGDLDNLPADGPITICEPACGAGAMILALGKTCPPEIRRRLRVTAIDINRSACHMTFINTTLWGIPTRVIHGNSLTIECWAAWSNIHWLLPWLSLIPMHPLAGMSSPSPGGEIGQGEPPKPAEVERLRSALTQSELKFG